MHRILRWKQLSNTMHYANQRRWGTGLVRATLHGCSVSSHSLQQCSQTQASTLAAAAGLAHAELTSAALPIRLTLLRTLDSILSLRTTEETAPAVGGWWTQTQSGMYPSSRSLP